MRNRGLIFLGSIFILLGLMSIIGIVFKVNLWAICFPTALILIGVGILVSSFLNFPPQDIKIRPLVNTRRSGDWQVSDEEIWTVVGGIRLDMTEAEIPVGETCIQAMGFVGDIRLRLPEDIAYSISSTAFVNELHIMGKKIDTVASTVRRQSEGYDEAQQKIRLEALYFVVDLRIDQA